MKIYRNVAEINRREQIGRRFSMVGLLILFIGLLASFVPNWYPPDEEIASQIGRFLQANWVYISFVALPAGFICASIGSFYINRFARRRWPGRKALERPDEVLERGLKGLDDKYAYFAWSLPANYVLMGPCGILVFVLRSDKGKITVDGERWREPFRLSRIFTVFAREGVGNPSRDLDDQKEKLHKLLQEADAAEGEQALTDVPMEGVAVFLNPDIELDIKSSSLPVLRGDQLKGFIRRKAKEANVNSSTLRRLRSHLEAHSQVSEE